MLKGLAPGSCWEHYKGGRYVVVAMAVCSETGKDMVVYRTDNRYSDKVITYVRPLEMWNQIVSDNNHRFTKVN